MSAIGKIVQEIALKVTGLDDAKKLDQQVDGLEKRKAKVTVDADTTAAKNRLDEIDRQIDALNNEKAKVQVDANTADADRKLDEINREIDALAKEKANVTVDANIAAADRKLDEIQREIRSLERLRAEVEVDADTASAERKLNEIDRQLDALRRQTTHAQVDIDSTPATGALGKLKTAASGAFDFIGTAAGGAMVTAGAAVAAFAAKAIGSFQDLALESGKMSDALGLSSEDASRWIEVAGDIGIGSAAIETSFGKLLQTIGKSPKAFSDLGIEMARTADGAVDVNETILNVIDHLNKIEDPTQRAAEAQKLLGKSWKDSAELINAGSDSIREGLAAVSDAKVIDPNEVKQAREFRDNMDNLSDSAEDLSIALGSTLGPVISDLAGGLSDLLALLHEADDLTGGKLAEFGKVSVPGGAFRDIDKGAAGALRQLQSAGWADADVALLTLTGDSEAYADALGDVEMAAAGFIQAHKPMSDMPAEWRAVEDAVVGMRKGLEPTREQMQAVMTLTTAYGIDAKTVFDKAGAAIEQNKNKTSSAVSAYTEFAKGMHDLAVKEEEAANAAKVFNETIASTDFAATGIEGGITGMSKFHEQFFALTNIASVAEEAFDNLDKSLKENGKTFDLNTEKGRANQAAVEDLASAVDLQLAAAFDAADGSLGEFSASAANVSDTLRNRLIKEMGLSKQEADDLIARLGLMPGDIETRYRLSGTEEAKLQLELLQGTIERLPKNVQAVIDYKILMGDYVGAVQTAQNYANRHPVTIPVELRVTTANLTAAQQRAINEGRGGAEGFASSPPGGYAGEAGPEFIRRPGHPEELLTYPAFIPTGTRVTSVKRTRAILARRGAHLRPMATGGIAIAAPLGPLTVNINAAVIGSRYDVAKAVGQGTRDLRRLVGARG